VSSSKNGYRRAFWGKILGLSAIRLLSRGPLMKRLFLVAAFFSCALLAFSQTDNPNKPTWWTKYQYLSQHGASGTGATLNPLTESTNADASNECGPQSETFIAINPSHPRSLAGGSNEIFRLPMRGYFSSDDGNSWGAVDLPLPPALSGTNDTRFGSDPSVAFDTQGNLYYSYIVVFFGNGSGVNGSEMAVARSQDGGQTYPFANFFSFATGSDHFNDKPMITVDDSLTSPFRDHVYVAWDASSGGSSAGGIRVGASSDRAQNFTITRADNPSGPSEGIGAVPFTGPNGELYVAWSDYHAQTIAFNSSFDGGATWGNQVVIAPEKLAFQALIPAESFRGALVYPACATDRSTGPHRGRLYCSWMDLNAKGSDTDIFLSHSDNRGATWSKPEPITDQLQFPVDRFNHWLAVDPTNGDVNVSFYDTRNDTTGSRYMTDVYFTQSLDGGLTWRSPNTRVTGVSSNEHDCNGVFPCPGIDYGNQQGDYEGLASYGGESHPVWTDSRDQLKAATGCRTDLIMEEVFSATVN